MLPRGLEFLSPIRKLITLTPYMQLSFNDINVYYTKYVNNFKHPVVNGEESIEDAIQAGLTPGKN